MSEIISLITNNPWIALTSLTAGIISTIFAFYSYFKNKKQRTPTYAKRTINLIKDNVKKIGAVEIFFQNKLIKNLSITKIAFWNDGKETINLDDVAKNDLIKFKIKDDYKILDAKIIYEKNPANAFHISTSPDNKHISLTFDYFDFGEGIVLEISHTGNNSSDFSILGSIKSVRCFKDNSTGMILPAFLINLFDKLFSKIKFKTIIGWTTLLAGILIIIFPVSITVIAKKPIFIELPYWTLLKFFPSILAGFLYLLASYNMIKRRIPKGFDIFNEEF